MLLSVIRVVLATLLSGSLLLANQPTPPEPTPKGPEAAATLFAVGGALVAIAGLRRRGRGRV